MPVVVVLWCVAALLGSAVISIFLARTTGFHRIIYGICLTASVVALAVAGRYLLAGAEGASTLTLPVGLPWLGAHFAVDALPAFFLVVINLGGAAASLYGLGYGGREEGSAVWLMHHIKLMAHSIDSLPDGLVQKPGLKIRLQQVAEAAIRDRTGCSVVAVERGDELIVDLGRSFRFEAEDTAFVAGSSPATRAFLDHFG